MMNVKLNIMSGIPLLRVVAESRGVLYLFFCLETKEPKIQGSNSLGYKLALSAKPFELAFGSNSECFLTPRSLICSRHGV
jgi:hypothetical protein